MSCEWHYSHDMQVKVFTKQVGVWLVHNSVDCKAQQQRVHVTSVGFCICNTSLVV